MPAITAKAANRLPLTPHLGRKKPKNLPSLPIENRRAMPFPPAEMGLIVGRQYRVTKLTKLGTFGLNARILRNKTTIFS
jgi:hypothetical protein